jgi:hypothetical protein
MVAPFSNERIASRVDALANLPRPGKVVPPKGGMRPKGNQAGSSPASILLAARWRIFFMPRAAQSTNRTQCRDETFAAKPSSPEPDTFGALGLYGFERLAAVLVAALATEEPLLLIGPHGTAKSLLLTRVASALGLAYRHYNASLLNFDDLIGFPLPDREGKLSYLQTPATIWGAGAVIFDEISRFRPDIQNKLFPIIHERRAQGLALEGLRYRWAAMNPPSADGDDTPYLGSEPR